MKRTAGGRAHCAVTIIGKDRPGIVSAAAEVLYRLGCNVEDSSCTMLGGEFAMILIVSHDKPFGKGRLQDEFRQLGEGMQLSVFVRQLSADEISYRPPQGEICLLTVYGSDRPGIVYRVTSELASRGINITDLNTKLVGSEKEPVYVMMLEAALPEEISIELLSGILDQLRRELQVEISVRSVTPVSL